MNASVGAQIIKEKISVNHIQFTLKELDNLGKENKVFYQVRNYSCIFNQW